MSEMRKMLHSMTELWNRIICKKDKVRTEGYSTGFVARVIENPLLCHCNAEK